MTNIPLAIISGFTAVLFFKCEWDEARGGSKSGAILMSMLGLISVACAVMATLGVGC